MKTKKNYITPQFKPILLDPCEVIAETGGDIHGGEDPVEDPSFWDTRKLDMNDMFEYDWSWKWEDSE